MFYIYVLSFELMKQLSINKASGNARFNAVARDMSNTDVDYGFQGEQRLIRSKNKHQIFLWIFSGYKLILLFFFSFK